jgi:nanoRNase/pAp phosphatase (c-di-AMP/oligoRNAs hydrolase)
MRAQQHMVVIVRPDVNINTIMQGKSNILYRKQLTSKRLFQELHLQPADRLILNFNNNRDLSRAIDHALSCCEHISITALVRTHADITNLEQCVNVAFLSSERLLDEHITLSWKTIDNRKKVARLRQITEGLDNILILTQHDPDPDALAGGLALRTLLGRTSITAPIGSFGEVTRNENQTMMQLLDIHLIKITADDLQRFSKIAMVDVQPFYFGDPDIAADIIIDHHPQMEAYAAPFCDIRSRYGATSTILTEYLFAERIKISQRLATALVYGIKTDTLLLGRDINPADIEAFTHIYPLANRHMILQMDHPSLKPEEINLFIKALKSQKLIDKAVFVDLGRVDKEDIIPRLADFCMQIDGAQWSVITGIVDKNIVLCVRNVGYVEHAGELARLAFGKLGSAGGHRSAAKAVMPLSAFKKYFQISHQKDIKNKIIDIFLKAQGE